METTEKIVESYCRYVRNWFTIANVKCVGQNEIDLLGVEFRDNGQIKRYHVESSVSISGGFSKLTEIPFDPVAYRIPVRKPKLRRSIYYFIERKFSLASVVEKLASYGFTADNHERIIVTWGWTPAAKSIADERKITLLDFREILKQLKKRCEQSKVYFKDDTIRTIQLFVRSKPGELLSTK
jgi:hypothetical protein